MELRVCPDCSKAFYAQIDGERISCPHCGFSLYDRRGTDRVHMETVLSLTIKGMKLQGKLKDYSLNGLRVEYSGGAFDDNEVIDVDIDELNIHGKARAVWSKELSGSQSTSGLLLL